MSFTFSNWDYYGESTVSLGDNYGLVLGEIYPSKLLEVIATSFNKMSSIMSSRFVEILRGLCEVK